MPLIAPLSTQSAAPAIASDAFCVTAIGSCRVAGPLRRPSAADGYVFNQSGVYGYCHSAAEAVQQVRTLQGDLSIPQELQPLIAPSGLPKDAHHPSDLYLVELCSGKELSTQGYNIQLNYLTRHFADFFSQRERVRTFWALARAHDRAAMKAFLLEEHAYWALGEADRHLLEDVRLTMATAQTLLANVSTLAQRLNNPLFVTHFNANKHDGSPLISRAQFIDLTKETLSALSLRVFDPSDYVEAFGPTRALEANSRSLTHYSKEFEAVLKDNWLRRYIQPAIARKTEALATNGAPLRAAG